jgi:hypothetical protein
MRVTKKVVLGWSVASVLIATIALSCGMDWMSAEHAPLQKLSVQGVKAADCLSYTALHPMAGPADTCTLTGYVHKATVAPPRPCHGAPMRPDDGERWGLSEGKHGRGQTATFCIAQIVMYESTSSPR